MWLPRDDPILGLDPGYVLTNLSLVFRVLMDPVQDTHDTENSTMFDDDKVTGLGRWGDPNDDIQITTGGFRDLVRVYPSPHRIRRRYTLQPLANIPNPFPNDPLAPPIDTSILINGSFTRANHDFLLNGFVGDFRGFQAYLEGPRVCSSPSPPFDILTRYTGHPRWSSSHHGRRYDRFLPQWYWTTRLLRRPQVDPERPDVLPSSRCEAHSTSILASLDC